jgi:hypothetical protein
LIRWKLINSILDGTDDIKYFIAALRHFNEAGFNIDIADIFNLSIRGGHSNFMTFAALNNNINCLSVLLTIEGLEWTGIFANRAFDCPLVNAEAPETAEFLLNAGGGINVFLRGDETLFKCDLTNKVIFGHMMVDGKRIQITRDIPEFKKAITNRYELAEAIRKNHLSYEVIENLKKMFLCKRAELASTPKKLLGLSVLCAKYAIDKNTRPSIKNSVNEELTYLEDIILILQTVKPNTTLKNIAFNSILKNSNYFFQKYKSKERFSPALPNELLEEIPSLKDAQKRLAPYMNN